MDKQNVVNSTPFKFTYRISNVSGELVISSIEQRTDTLNLGGRRGASNVNSALRAFVQARCTQKPPIVMTASSRRGFYSVAIDGRKKPALMCSSGLHSSFLLRLD